MFPLQGIYPREMESCIHTKLQINVNCSSIHDSQRIGKNPNVYPMMNKQNMAYPYNGILLSIKKSALLIHATTWMNLRNIMLIERSQSQRTTNCPQMVVFEVCRLGQCTERVDQYFPGAAGRGRLLGGKGAGVVTAQGC